MNLIIVSILLTIITFIIILIDKTNVKGRIRISFKPRAFISLLWLLLIVFGCFKIIPANTVGIRYNAFNGGIQDKTLGEGFILKTPIDIIYNLSTEVKELNFTGVTVQTADSQWISTQLQVQVQIDTGKAFEYFKKYRNKKFDDISSIIQSTVQKELESVSTQYNIMEILGEERSNIVTETSNRIQEELIKDGIIVQRFVLVDTEAGETIENAIAKEAAAKKEAETAKYLKEKAELEGEAKVIAAKKEKEANELKTKALTEAILKEKFIEKWDGKLPVVTDGSNIFDISKLMD